MVNFSAGATGWKEAGRRYRATQQHDDWHAFQVAAAAFEQACAAEEVKFDKVQAEKVSRERVNLNQNSRCRQ